MAPETYAQVFGEVGEVGEVGEAGSDFSEDDSSYLADLADLADPSAAPPAGTAVRRDRAEIAGCASSIISARWTHDGGHSSRA